MTISDDIYTVCSGYAGLTALVADRIYRSREQPTPPTTYPQVVYTVPISDDNSQYRTHDDTPGRTVTTVQFDCLAQTANEADDVAAQLRARWDGHQSASPDIGYAFVNNIIDDGFQPGTDVYRVIVEVEIETGV